MKKNENFEKFLAMVREETEKANEIVTADLVSLASKIGDKVQSFLTENNIARPKESNGAWVATEAFNDDTLAEVGFDSINGLVETAGVPSMNRSQAVEAVALMLGRNATAGSYGDAWGRQSARQNDFSGGLVSMEDMYPSHISALFKDSMLSTESFGVGTDSVLVDMKIAITVSLMKWHTTLTPRMLAVLGTSSSIVQYKKETLIVYDLNDPTDKDTRVIDLYDDPSLVSNELKQIVPAEANDSDDVLVADGIIRFDAKANILELSIDAAKYGYTTINRTDLVADGVLMEKVYIELADGIDVETFEIAIPKSKGRLSRTNNGESSLRQADVVHTALLTAATTQADGNASTLMAKLGDPADAIAVALQVKPDIDLKTGMAYALGGFTVAAANTTGVAADTATDTLVANIVTNTVPGGAGAGLTGYTLDAKFSEENMRKSDIAVTNETGQLAYNIPTGRNYLIDYAMGDDRANAGTNAANLNAVIRIGQDDRALKLIEAVMLEVKDANALKVALGDSALDIGQFYAAGNKVRPTVLETSLDLGGITTDRDDVRFQLIAARTEAFLTSVIAELHTKSFYTNQLVNGQAPVYRVITSNKVKDNVLGVQHYHNHLDKAGAPVSGDGVELRIVLKSGVILEVITTTFSTMDTKMIIIPFLPGQPKSELNFGTNWDYGTMVGHYHHSDGHAATNRRIYANTRELPVPTNVVGAIVTVENIDEAMFRI